MPKKAVAIYFLAAFVCAVIFVYFTFPRTKEEIPQSNNQRPFPSAPPTPTPNSVPVPETVPRPTTPTVPPGPTLHAMAWASGAEAQILEAEADAFGEATGRHISLLIDGDVASYRADLRQAMASNTPPDVCLVVARDFSGLDPNRDLAEAPPPMIDSSPRSITAFTVGDQIKAVPDEFSVDLLFYNPSYFDQAGFGYPGPHWNWDILESISRGIASLKLKDPSGQTMYPLELPADFDFWNILCMQAGHAALDQTVWHLGDADTKDSQVRALDLIHEIFQEYAITAPLPKPGEPPGSLFAQQRVAILIAPSELSATLPQFPYHVTVLPSDIGRANLARINGWAVTTRSSDIPASRVLAEYLAWQPVHSGWSSVRKSTDTNPDSIQSVCYEALGQSLIPRIEPKTAPLAQFLDEQINLLARTPEQDTDALYARIQTEYQNETGSLPPPTTKPIPKTEGSSQLRGL
jgi:ABC-type glycerol-3-phosphate transport system substrate-binding protein